MRLTSMSRTSVNVRLSHPQEKRRSRKIDAASALVGELADISLSSPALLLTDHAAPYRKAFGRMLIHPLGELRRAHQTGLHGDVGEVRSGDGLLVATYWRRKTAEHGDDLDHEKTPSDVQS